MDYLELGEIPPEGSDQWLAPFAQEAFDKYIKNHSKLAVYIKNNCSLEIN